MAKVKTQTQFVGEITNEMIVNEWNIATRNPEQEEIEKCKASPYYFYTHYFLINGKPATTTMTETEFNNHFFAAPKK